MRWAWAVLWIAAACQPPPPQHVGAATPVLTEDDATAADKKRFPRSGLQSSYRLSQRDSCGPRCAYIHQGAARLALDMKDDGSATAHDAGAAREIFQSHRAHTEQRIEWERGWRGTWEGRDGTIAIELTPEALTCKRTDQNGATDSPCQLVPLALECVAVDVILEGKPPSTEVSWMCEPTHNVHGEGLTPFPWVFGMRRSLLARDGGTSQAPTRRYRLRRPEGNEPSARR